jgi:DNA-directed RNA polymerase, delta subunit
MKTASITDMAYEILKKERLPLYYKEVLDRVVAELALKPKEVTPEKLASFHTQISLDSRFAYQGKHMWSLVEWIPQRGVKTLEELTTPTTDKSRRKKLLEEIQDNFSAEEPEKENTEPVE